MKNYCPVCFNNTLFVKSSGVINVMVNDMQMDAGRILYNTKNDKDVAKQDLKDKIEEFFKWYGNFQNKKGIKSIKLFSSDFKCTNGCKVSNKRMSIVDIIFTSQEIMDMITENADKYDLKVELTIDDIS